MRGLEGKSVIVTGGGGAIGGAICRRFAGYGAHVGVFDKNLDAAKKIAGEIKGIAYGVDIADYAAVGTAIARFEKDIGPTDILVNNAGWDRFANFVDTTPDLWDTLIGINLRGPLNVSHFRAEDHGGPRQRAHRQHRLRCRPGRVFAGGRVFRLQGRQSLPSPRPWRARWRARASP